MYRAIRPPALWRRCRLWLALGLIAAGCTWNRVEAPSQVVTGGVPLPDREIVFMTGVNQLGFINPDGSGYERYAVDMSKWMPGGKFIRTIEDRVTWSSSGMFLAGRYSGNNRSSGVPILISTSGELRGCTENVSPYGSDRVWVITDTIVLVPDISGQSNRIVGYDLSRCMVTEVFYSAKDLYNETLLDASLSTTGWLAINRYIRKGEAFIDDVLVISPHGDQQLSISDASHSAWSMDGEWIAFFLSGDGIYVMRKDGTNRHRVVESVEIPTAPSWSPDGQWLVYERLINTGDGAGKTPTIFKANVVTNEEVELFKGGYHPYWRWNRDTGQN